MVPKRLAVVLLLCLTGCFRVELDELARDQPAISRHLLQLGTEPGTTNPPRGTGPTLLLRNFHAEAPYHGRSFIYRLGESEYGPDYYQQFLVSPAQQLTQLTLRYLRGTGNFGAVLSIDSSLGHDFVLDADLLELYADHRSAGQAKAVLRLRAVLSTGQAAEAADRCLLQKEYAAAVALTDRKPTTLVAAWNEALARVLAELAGDILEKTKK